MRILIIMFLYQFDCGLWYIFQQQKSFQIHSYVIMIICIHPFCFHCHKAIGSLCGSKSSISTYTLSQSINSKWLLKYWFGCCVNTHEKIKILYISKTIQSSVWRCCSVPMTYNIIKYRWLHHVDVYMIQCRLVIYQCAFHALSLKVLYDRWFIAIHCIYCM